MHLLMLPWLAFGHIVPFVQLARRLLSSTSSSVRVTFLTAAGNVPRVEAMLSSPSSAGEAAVVVPLRLPHVPGLPEDAASTADLSPEGAELLKAALDAARPQVAALLAELRPDAVLLDFATPWAAEDAAALGAKSLWFSVFSAVAGAYLSVPARRPDAAGQLPSARDLMSAPAGFPGSSPLAAAGVPAYQAADFTYMFTSFGGQPCVHERVVAGIRACDGLVLKTCAEMEGAYIDYLAAQFRKPVLVAGPLVPGPPAGDLDDHWATWLSAFPDGAVVFASFGSETFLPPAAATELLLGLEATGRPFLAVLNSPDGAVPPPGFAERVSGRGLVHAGWVPQQHILRHRSVGCYLTHAGFSSVVEGLVAGCRLVLLPMKGDQFLNAALFARELRVGVEVARRDDDGWFGRQDVCDAITAAVADGGERDARKWADFLTDDGVQGRFADEFVRQLRELVGAASS